MEVEREIISIMVKYLAHASKSFADKGSYLRNVLTIGCDTKRREEFTI